MKIWGNCVKTLVIFDFQEVAPFCKDFALSIGLQSDPEPGGLAETHPTRLRGTPPHLFGGGGRGPPTPGGGTRK